MRFALSDDQLALVGAVREVLSDRATGEQLRKAATDPVERTGTLWGLLAELGVFSALVPEEHGGLGLGGVEAVLIAEELGRWAVPGPVAESALVVPYVMMAWGTRDVAARWLPQLVDGAVVATVRVDPGGLVPDADLAGLVLLANGGAVRGARPDQLVLTAQPGIDPSRRLFTATVEEAWLPVIAAGAPAAAAMRDMGAVATAAQLLGASHAVLDQAVAYARERSQFGRAIGSYQALKHQLATVRVALDFARPLALRAGYELTAGSPTSSRSASSAKAAAADAAQLAARTALQVHGGIGYTDELDLQLWLKRIWSLLPQWGTATAHRAAVLGAVAGQVRPGRFP